MLVLLYFGSTDGKLHALKSNSEKKCVFDADSAITDPPSISEDGAIYFGTADGKLYALENGLTFSTPFTKPFVPISTFSPSGSPPCYFLMLPLYIGLTGKSWNLPHLESSMEPRWDIPS